MQPNSGGGARAAQDDRKLPRREPFPRLELEDFAIAGRKPLERTADRFDVELFFGAIGEQSERGLQPQAHVEQFASSLSATLVGKDTARHPVEPETRLVAERHLVEPAPSDERRLGDACRLRRQPTGRASGRSRGYGRIGAGLVGPPKSASLAAVAAGGAPLPTEEG